MAPTAMQPLKVDTADSIDTFRSRLQPYLEAFIEAKTAAYTRYTPDPLLISIWAYPRCLVQARGKRIRPYVAYLMYRAMAAPDEVHAHGGDIEADERPLEVLLALELFHLFCLVHDDVIDRGRERHALPTAHRYVTARLVEENRLHDLEHIGNAQAILLGDMLFAWAQEAFHSSREFGSRALHRAGHFFHAMIDEVVIGEMLDVDMMTRRHTSAAAINQKMLLKTASYTFIRPMQIGAALADAGDGCEQFCYDLGLALGTAFQLQDDLLDIVGTPETTRKTLFADLRERQHTCFTQFIFDHGTSAQRARLNEMFGANLQPGDRDAVLDLFETSGALRFGQAHIRRNLARAYCLLDDAEMPLRDKAAFCDLIALLQVRTH